MDAPVYLLPDAKREPLLIAKKGSSGDVLALEGDWVRISFDDEQRRTRVGYILAKQVAIVRDEPSAPTPKLPSNPVPSTPAATVAQSAARPATDTRTQPNASPVPAPSSPRRADEKPGNRRLKEVKIRGYVTDLRSSTDFDIEDYRILRDQEFALDFENASPDVAFHLADIRVGVELEIRGTLDEENGELRAKAIKVDLEQFRTIEQTAFVSARPEGIQLLDGSWAGELRADGQIIRVTSATAVVFKPTKREKKLAERTKKTAAAEEEEEITEPLKSLDQVTVGMAMTYEGKRDRETGKILAQRIEFSNNDLEDGESRMWKSLKTTVKAPQGLKQGELKIDNVGKYRLLPDATVQAYIAKIGQRLIPAYQRELPSDDPRRIPFQFHVVRDNRRMRLPRRTESLL
jgi:hypothetical protein